MPTYKRQRNRGGKSNNITKKKYKKITTCFRSGHKFNETKKKKGFGRRQKKKAAEKKEAKKLQAQLMENKKFSNTVKKK